MKQRWSKLKTEPLRTFMRRGALFVLAPLLALTITLSPVATQPANAQLAVGQMLGGSLTNGLSTCAIETVGWVICPTMRSIAKLADYGFTYINSSFLKLDYSLSSDTSGTFKAWEIMRNIANGLFVVAFMALIYSQLTGRTSGGYNIKRLLPRLIICAILVNLSYFLCQILVEGSNIIGGALLEILNGLAKSVGPSVMPIGASPNAFQDGTLSVITSQIMAKTGYAWVLLAPTAAVTISIATVTAAALILLILRKVIVAMLILVSPILFVAFLMPNLERFFFQGLRLFLQLLLLYPIIALLLGAGQIVSATIVSIGSGDSNNSYRVTGDGYMSQNSGTSGSAVTDLTAAAAAVMPLLGVWFLFKGMNNIMSTAGSKLSASVSGRRGGKDDEKARVTGKASSGASNLKNTNGIGGLLGRKQAFSRTRRRKSLGGSAITGDGNSSGDKSNLANRRPVSDANAALQESITGRNDAGQRKNEDIQNANIADGETGDMNVESAVAAAMAANQTQGQAGAEQEKQKTAKDIFNNLNRGHEAKDKDRKFNAGPAPAGGSGSAAGSAQPSAPVASYKAPNIAQGGNIVSGGASGQPPTQIIAVPVTVDTSSLLGQQQRPTSRPPENMAQPPISGTEEKAKARAQKYLFDTGQDLDDARDRMDILGKKDAPIEPPHTSTKDDHEDNK